MTFPPFSLRKFAACGLAAAWLLFPALASATTFLIETAKLELPGGWEQTTLNTPNVHKFLLAGAQAKGAPAVGGVEVPHAGQWHLWVRSKDFPADRPGTRRFTVRLGAVRATGEFGRHAQAELDGWAWEDGGTLTLPGGPTLVVLGDTVTSSARCDALVLTDNLTYRPEGVPWKLSKEAAHYVPLTWSEKSTRNFLPETLGPITDQAVAALENEGLRLSFHQAATSHGSALTMRVATRSATGWQRLTEIDGEEGYRILSRPLASDPKIVPDRLNPIWETSLSPEVEAECGGSTARTRLGIATAPWCSGHAVALRPSGARQVDPRTVALTFPATEAGQLSATWRLAEGQPSAAVTLHFAPARPGHYSLGYHGPLAAAVESTDFVLLPFQYHAHRLPEQPAMLLSAYTPTPLALVNRGGVSCALVAEPEEIPFAWPDLKNSRYALGLRNEHGQAQPLLYTPVLGQEGSVSTGAAMEGRFRLWVQRGDWYAAYRRVADEVFALRDYRRPVTASLSDTALNLFDFLRNEEASGWSAKAKGPWNIESRNTVSHSSPLTYLSYYLLTGDEDFYTRFARPALEFLLSRPGPHFAAEREIWENYYTHQPLRGPGSFYGASTFASALAMTHGRSAVFGEFCLDSSGGPRLGHGGGHTQSFADWLALYELTGEARWLAGATAAADRYVAANLTTLPAKDLGPTPFVNVSFVPDWEGLSHLYEATHELRYLAAAREGARWLATTLWTQPCIPAGEVTIHPGGLYDANRHIWWFGDGLFRRGVFASAATWEAPYPPPVPLPERRVPAWQVSPVGLGLEQPSTYNRHGPKANILMSVWAPSLLRLAGPAGDPAFRTAARNAFLGRFANYPGYYLDGMTTEYQRPDYPLKGPDVTSLYVHHAPPFAAAVLDYLFTDAEARSGGAVTFPSVRQCGYVWFDSRLYGHAPGQVYGQSAWPWLHRTAATVDNINVDRLLAEGEGKFHVILLNQVHEPQTVHVSLDAAVLGRNLPGAQVSVRRSGVPAAPLPVQEEKVELTLEDSEIAVLTLDGVHIDIPTHRSVPPAHFALPTAPVQQHASLPGTTLEAVGSLLVAPPFTWRDLFVYVTAAIDDVHAARLFYHTGSNPEQHLEAASFPWEFTARLPAGEEPISWRVEVQMADGRWVAGAPPASPQKN